MRQLIDAVISLAPWLRDEWWPREKTNTMAITSALEQYLPVSGSATPLGALRPGWNLETRERYPEMPFLYGEGDQSIKSVRPDAVHVDDSGRLTLVEIEGGGAETNYRGMKDIVESLLLPDVDYLALVVPFRAHHTKPYDTYNNLVTSLYAQRVIQGHLEGLLVLGY
jgi:hypothetical protein